MKRENSITDTKDAKKEKVKAYDVLGNYDRAIEKIQKIDVSPKTKILVKRYYTNSLLSKVNSLQGKDKSDYIKEIRKRKVYKNIKATNLKQVIKKIMLMVSINLYLNFRQD